MREHEQMEENPNKDEAIRAFELGKQAFHAKDFQRAQKFLNKSIQLHKTDQAVHFLYLAQQETTTSSTSSSSTPSSSSSSSQSHSNKNSNNNNESHRETKKTTTTKEEFEYKSSSNANAKRESFKAKTSTTSKTESTSDENNKNNSTTSSSNKNSNASNSDSPGQQYSEKQKVEVERIISTTDYYEILSISKTSTEDEVKRAYKKLAIQVHPDKNKAPNSEEAFKKISKAFSCLSDSQKRKVYDVSGQDDQTPQMQRRNPFGGGGGGGAGSEDFENLTPEEIFAYMFFNMPPSRFRGNNGGGGGVHQRRQTGGNPFVRTYTFGGGGNPFGFQQQRHYQTHEEDYEEETENHQHQGQRQYATPRVQRGIWQWITLLPFLIYILMMFFPMFRSDPLYNLDRQQPYNVARTTSNDIPYFVKSDFNLNPATYQFKNMERELEDYYLERKFNYCEHERTQKSRHYSRWRQAANAWFPKKDDVEKLKKVYEDFKSPHCDEYEGLRTKIRKSRR